MVTYVLVSVKWSLMGDQKQIKFQTFSSNSGCDHLQEVVSRTVQTFLFIYLFYLFIYLFGLKKLPNVFRKDL